MTIGCHSQQNCYGAHRKIWLTLGQTTGERTCRKVTSSHKIPEGEKLNAQPLSREAAIKVALNQPGGGVIYALDKDKTLYNVYSEWQSQHFRDILKRIKQRRPK